MQTWMVYHRVVLLVNPCLVQVPVDSQMVSGTNGVKYDLRHNGVISLECEQTRTKSRVRPRARPQVRFLV